MIFKTFLNSFMRNAPPPPLSFYFLSLLTRKKERKKNLPAKKLNVSPIIEWPLKSGKASAAKAPHCKCKYILKKTCGTGDLLSG
jgi:hypothetical protein